MKYLLNALFPDITFGTSGVRALVTDLTSSVIASYTYAFITHLQQTAQIRVGQTIAVGIDLRPSSPTISMTVCETLQHLGYSVEFLGAVPTPALALHCLTTQTAGMMITGSHIPFSRNGIKFYTAFGEILKNDEQAILNQMIPNDIVDLRTNTVELPPLSPAPLKNYSQRYIDYFKPNALEGLRIGVYEHSAVGRDMVRYILQALGAIVVPLGRSDDFVPIDTEAVSKKDIDQAHLWCTEHCLDALVSTDGDGDRPLVFDATGQFIPGDLLGLMCARSLNIQNIVIPVSCSTAIEKSKIFKKVIRTRIGSPYVIKDMTRLLTNGTGSTAGFEANGGFLLGTSLPGLRALPTRDALLPLLSLLVLVKPQQHTISKLMMDLPKRFTYSDRLKDIPSTLSDTLLKRMTKSADLKVLFPEHTLFLLDKTDGIRMTFSNDDIVHLRASGNAPELRCYTESHSHPLAKTLCETTLQKLSSW